MSDPQSSSTNWFGRLQLAYKYIVVFCGLLVLVFVAGAIKVFFDRRKLQKVRKKEELEAGLKEDTVELNQREKDEGDLFGIRAIEAGFYAGVAQSRPVSRATSVRGQPTMSSSTLIGESVNSPLMKGQSCNNSVLSLNLGQSDANAQRRLSPPTPKLRPSEAELNGKHGAVDMTLQVPFSPPIPRSQTSTSFGSDDGSSDGSTTPQHYTSTATIVTPNALQGMYYNTRYNNASSHVASFNSSPATSPTPPCPGNPPSTQLPTLPSTALCRGSRSPSPEYNFPQVGVEHSSR
ncbi:hypothetical protein BDU57DRAFT_513850 [Ampelomyces quisqualis]|uniref:Uncharacterized protein n=1 Tax=Ampelomyces quisqualis TaxID=50730 RepID=A0A6A5QQ75_AMPQU|nr:hypothetical protein BDU57DRAFT_513850 [Ampelomyces quisqualis]